MLIQEKGFGVYKGKCVNCGNETEVYMLSEFSYGEKLLLTEDGEDFAYLNCFADIVFNEIGDIVHEFCKNKGYSDLQIAEYTDSIFGLTCDPIYGKKIDTQRIQRTCKKCKFGQISISTGPIRAIKASVPIVTHSQWEQKRTEEQMAIIQEYLKNMGCP